MESASIVDNTAAFDLQQASEQKMNSEKGKATAASTKVEPPSTMTDPAAPMKKFFCPCCNIGYATSEEMINHIKESPIKVKTYSCQICLLEFFVKSDLIDHQRLDHQMAVHKKYKCDECDLDFTTLNQLTRHKKMHQEIAEKLAASGIFLPRPAKPEAGLKKEAVEEGRGSSVPVSSPPSKPDPPSQPTKPDPVSPTPVSKPSPPQVTQRAKRSAPPPVIFDDNSEDNGSPDDATVDYNHSDEDYCPPSSRKKPTAPRAVKRRRSVKERARVPPVEVKLEIEEEMEEEVCDEPEAEPEEEEEEPKEVEKPRRTEERKKRKKNGRRRRKGRKRSVKEVKETAGSAEANGNEPEMEIPADILNEDGSIRCPDCSVMCSSLNGLNRHRRFHFKTMDKLKCVFCDVMFENRIQMGSHMTQVHPLRKCSKAYMLRPVSQTHFCTEPGCGKVFTASVALTKHKMKVHGMDKYNVNSCEDCGKRFPSRSALTVHRRMHTDERPFKCDLCPKTYRASSSLVLHRKSHSDKKPFVCEYCGMGFTCPNSLRRHTRCRHTGEKPYMCDGCGATFTDHSQLAHHAKSHGHGKLSAPGQYSCDLCNRHFRTEFGFKSHKEKCIHGRPGFDGVWKPKPVICEVCGREFPSRLNLKNHMVTHTDERPHKCRFCEATFRHYKSKYSHEKIHKGQKDFICNICGKAFYQRINLKTHMTSHNEVKDLACRLCGKKFNSEHNRKRHEKRCLNYLKCPICSAIFRVQHRLVRHINLNHQGADIPNAEWLTSQPAQSAGKNGEAGEGLAADNRPTFVDMDSQCNRPTFVDSTDTGSHPTGAAPPDSQCNRPRFVDSTDTASHPSGAAPPLFHVEKNDCLSDEEQYVVNCYQGHSSRFMNSSINHQPHPVSPAGGSNPGHFQQEEPPLISSMHRFPSVENRSMSTNVSPSVPRGVDLTYAPGNGEAHSVGEHVNHFPAEQSRLIASTLSAEIVKEVYRSQHTTYLF